MSSPSGEDQSARSARLLLALVLVLGVAHAALYDWPFEDSFITYRYAENLARGAGLTYNPGEVVEGFTSFGWTVLLAGVSRCGLPIVGASRLLSLGCALALLWVTALTARRWMKRDDLWCVAPAVIVAANGTWGYYAGTGMETSLFALLVAAGVLFATGESRKDALLAGAALGVAALVRPEGVGYLGVIAAALVVDPRDRRLVLPMVSVFLALFVPYFLWRWQHFGFLLPNTYYAKASPSGSVFRNGSSQVEAYLTLHLFWLVVPALAFLARRRAGGWSKPWRLAGCVLVGAIVNMVLVGGDVFPFYRFLLPAIPAGAIAICAALAAWASESARGRTIAPVVAALLSAWTYAVAFLPVHSLTLSLPLSDRKRTLGIESIGEGYFAIGEWLRSAFPGKTLATNAAGIVPYLSGLPTIDMLGLNDVHIAHIPIGLGKGALGHEKHDGAYVLSRKPDVIILGLPTVMKRAPRPEELAGVVAHWFPFLPGDREIYESPVFRREYEPRGFQIGEGAFVLVFVRREGDGNGYGG